MIRILIYGALLFWAFICLFPIYWTITTSFKTAVNVTQGHLIPWVDFIPKWIGFRSLGLSPRTIFEISTVRDEFMQRFFNSVITSVGASTLAVILGSMAAYGLTRFQYQIGFFKNKDISFFLYPRSSCLRWFWLFLFWCFTGNWLCSIRGPD